MSMAMRAVALLLAANLLPPGAIAAPREGATFKDWVVRCERGAQSTASPAAENAAESGGPEQCFIVQNLVLKENNQRVMLIAVTYRRDEPDPVAVLTLPLGISLPPGISLSIDGGEPRRFHIERCLSTGCKAGFVLDPGLLSAFKAGIKAEITIHDGARKPVTLPVSLVGFTAGLQSLR